MRSVSIEEAQKDLDKIVDWSRQDAVILRSKQEPVAALVSMDDYEKLRSLRVEKFNKFCDEAGAEAARRGMTEEILKELLADES